MVDRYLRKLRLTTSTGKACDLFPFVVQIETKKKKLKVPKRIRRSFNRISKDRKCTKPRSAKDKRSKSTKSEKISRNYRVYINSAFWERRKKLFWSKFPKRCERCKGFRCIQLHHAYYDNSSFGNEMDSDLIPLCISCHGEFHRRYGTKKDMIDETLKFVENPMD